MDGIEPELISQLEHALEHSDGISEVRNVRLRWTGHRLSGDAELVLASELTLGAATAVMQDAEARARAALPKLDDLVVRPTTRS